MYTFCTGAEKLACIKKEKKVEELNDVTSALLCSKFKAMIKIWGVTCVQI